MNGSNHNNNSSPERRTHRAYRDPTADTAIGNIMREERLRKRQQQNRRTAFHKGYGGGRHGAK